MPAHEETSPHGPTVAVIGTGGLARAVCYALAAGTRPVRVLVLGRDPVKTAEICWISGARAIGAGDSPPPVTFRPVTVDPAAAGALAEALAEARPTAVLVAASLQSPWERISAPSAWTALIQRAGFGLTMPLQAVFAREAGRALAEHHPSGWLLNGCFPDAVNPALAGLGVAPLCGIGNVALTATGLQEALALPQRHRLQVLAHHLHLHSPPPGVEEVRAWVDGEPVPGVAGLLGQQRAASRAELNHVTGFVAARLLTELLAGQEVRANLPGPLGLPGGYPVRITAAGPTPHVELNLPEQVSRAEAVAYNEHAARHDGVVIEDGRVHFTRTAPGDLPSELSGGFPVTDLEEAAHCLAAFRDRLRDRD
ncbi:hypothetical protein [Streptomyces sp. NPDC001933]|uniref:hypothetical protein n=1 Tax=Streptomyces sp. NPDC001933 TaxID=3364626 RepID=UPI00367EE7EC